MQCIILAAGRGTRMKELTTNTPKPMVRIFGKPLLEHKMDMLPDCVDEIVLIIGYFGNQIKEYFGFEWKGRKISYVFQKNLNGTGGAIFEAKDCLRQKFLVTMGDDLYGTEDLALLAKNDNALLAKISDIPFSSGVLRTDMDGNLLEIIEKTEIPELGMINTGAYALTSDIFDYEPVQISATELGLPQTIARMSKDRHVKIQLATSWLQVGRPEDLPKAEDFLRMNKR